MIRDLVSALDYTLCAEVALGLFFVTFAMMTYATLRLSHHATDHFSHLPLSDQEQVPPHE